MDLYLQNGYEPIAFFLPLNSSCCCIATASQPNQQNKNTAAACMKEASTNRTAESIFQVPGGCQWCQT